VIRARLLFLLALTALLGLARAGRADEGPIVITRRTERPWLTLDPISGSFGVAGIYEHDQAHSTGGSATATDFLVTEELTLATGGTIVSPNLFQWSASGTAAGQEEWTSGNVGSSSSTFGFFDAYDVSGNLLSASDFPMSAYTTRSENYVNRAFAGLLRNQITAYGGSIRYRSPSLPTSLTYTNTETVQTDLSGKEQFTIEQENLAFNTSFQPWERNYVSLAYSYGTTKQNNPGTLSNGSQFQTVSLSHDWNIDPLSYYTLSQSLSYSDQHGTFSESRLRLDEKLRLHFLDNLDGTLAYTMERQGYTTSTLTQHLVTGSLTHKLYESLTTTARAGFSQTDNSYDLGGSSKVQGYFASLGTAYTKKMLEGHLGANLSIGWNQSQSSATGQIQQVIGNVQTFTDPQPIILTRAGIDAPSIAVFDAAGTRRYVPGVDYTVQTVGNTVQITRLVGGNIGAGDTVRLNYDINPLPAYTSDSLTFGAGASHTFDEGWLKGLNLFIRYYQVDQSISPASSGVFPNSIQDLTFGGEYRIWKLSLRIEDEHHHSTLAPYEALRIIGTYLDNWDERTTVSITVTESYITVPTDHSRTNSFTVDGRVAYQIARNLNASLLVRWRDDSYSRLPGITGLETQAELRWKLRQTELFLMARYTNLDTAEADTSSVIVQFGLTRNF
jgi:hypothetical protein